MSRYSNLFGLLALAGALLAAWSVPAAAEFFSCRDRPGQLLYRYTGTPDQYIRRQRRYSAPRYGHHYMPPRQSRRATYSGDARYWNGR